MQIKEIAGLANDVHALNKEFGDYSFLTKVAKDTDQLQNLANAFAELVVNDNNLQQELMLTTDESEKLKFLLASTWLEGLATGYKCCEIHSTLI